MANFGLSFQPGVDERDGVFGNRNNQPVQETVGVISARVPRMPRFVGGRVSPQLFLGQVPQAMQADPIVRAIATMAGIAPTPTDPSGEPSDPYQSGSTPTLQEAYSAIQAQPKTTSVAWDAPEPVESNPYNNPALTEAYSAIGATPKESITQIDPGWFQTAPTPTNQITPTSYSYDPGPVYSPYEPALSYYGGYGQSPDTSEWY